MERIMKKPELVDELSARTGFYKKNMKEVVEALSDIVVEHFSTATLDEPSELENPKVNQLTQEIALKS